MRRYLVVAHKTLGGDHLIEHVRSLREEGPCRFLLLVLAGLFLTGLGIGGVYPLGVSAAIAAAPGNTDAAAARLAIGGGGAILVAPFVLGALADRVGIGTAFGIVLTIIGATELAYFVNPLSAGVALFTTASYIFFYTPLKLRTSLSTIAGALPGALPAVIGWAAATNTLSIEGWVLFGIVFMWQMPHFLAIAWMYRDEYARAGMPLLPVIEPDGRSTGRQAVLYTAVLIPLSMMPTGVGLATAYYLVGAIVLGAIMLMMSLEFAVKRDMPTAKRLFFGSIIYLPILWALLVFDHRTR